MKVTRQDIIKILPLNDELKERLLNEWDTFSEDQQLNMEDVIWDTYINLYQTRYDLNTEIALEALSQGTESMDTKFAQRIKDKTDDELDQVLQQGIPAANLEETREKLQNLMQSVGSNTNTPTTEDTNNTSSN